MLFAGLSHAAHYASRVADLCEKRGWFEEAEGFRAISDSYWQEHKESPLYPLSEAIRNHVDNGIPISGYVIEGKVVDKGPKQLGQ